MHRAVLRCLCPEYTLWAEKQASSTCSAAGQIKALYAAGQGLFRIAPANKSHRLHYQSFHFSRHFAEQQLYRMRMILLRVAAFYSWELSAGWRETHAEPIWGRNRPLTSIRGRHGRSITTSFVACFYVPLCADARSLWFPSPVHFLKHPPYSPSLLASLQLSRHAARPLLLLHVRVISKNLMTL